jgi:hypothetical protein
MGTILRAHDGGYRWCNRWWRNFDYLSTRYSFAHSIQQQHVLERLLSEPERADESWRSRPEYDINFIPADPSLRSHEPGTRIGLLVSRQDVLSRGRRGYAVAPKRCCLVTAADPHRTGPWESKAFLDRPSLYGACGVQCA